MDQVPYVGIDVSAQTLAPARNDPGQESTGATFANTPTGHGKLIMGDQMRSTRSGVFGSARGL